MSRIRFFRHGLAIATFGALASAGCFVVDDTDDDDDGSSGEAGESNGGSSRGGSATGGRGGTENGGSNAGGSDNGGSSSGGGPPAGGSDSGGSSTGGSAPTGGTGPGGEAVMKYCNDLYKNNEPAPLTLVFAGVRATAVSGTCTPVVPDPCVPIPAVMGPTVALLDGTTEIVSGSFPDFVVADGEEILVLATVDEKSAMPGPTAQVAHFAEAYVCSETDPFEPVMLETKSAPFSLPLERSLRSELRPAAATWSKKRAAF